MEFVNLLISLLSGAAGGNLAGALFKERSLGVVGNSIVGILGGGIGSGILEKLGFIASTAAAGGFDLSSFVANVASSGVGGGLLLLLVSFVKGLLKK